MEGTETILDIGQAGGTFAVLLYLFLKFGWWKRDPDAERRQNEVADRVENVERVQGEHERKLEAIFVSTEEIRQKTKDLHSWHAKEDDLGVKMWYGRRDLMEAQTKALEEVTACNRELRDEVKTMARSNETLVTEIRSLRTAIDKLSGSWSRASVSGSSRIKSS